MGGDARTEAVDSLLDLTVVADTEPAWAEALLPSVLARVGSLEFAAVAVGAVTELLRQRAEPPHGGVEELVKDSDSGA